MAASTRADLIGNRYGHLPWRKRVINYSTASTATYQLSPRESGAVFYCPTVSTISFELPKISSKFLGLNYEIYFSTADAAGDYQIFTADTSAFIHLALSTAATGIGTPTTITPNSTDVPHAIRVTAISSIIWMGEPLLMNGFSTHDSTNDHVATGGWTTQ